MPIEKTRIVTPANVIKAYAAMFLAEPHRTTRNYAALKAKVGTDIFAKGQRMEPYYTAAYTLYKLEYYFRNNKLDAKYKAARFHILLAARILANPADIPRDNSREMEKFCKQIMDILWDSSRVDELINKSTQVIDAVAAGDFDRDKIRTEPFTNKVLSEAKRLASLQVAKPASTKNS